MYCSNCGKQLNEAVNFCSKCGKSVAQNVQNVENVDFEHIGNTGQITGQSVRQPLVMEHKFSYSSQRQQLTSGNNVYTSISLVLSGILIILMFTKWYEVPIISFANNLFDGYINLPSKFSIFDFFTHFMSFQKAEISSTLRTLISCYMIINLALWLALLFFLGYYIKVIFKDKVKDIETFDTAIVLILIIFVINFIAMIIINRIGSSEGMELTGVNIVKLNFGMYFMAFIALAAKFMLVKKVKEEFRNVKNQEAGERV